MHLYYLHGINYTKSGVSALLNEVPIVGTYTILYVLSTIALSLYTLYCIINC